MDTVHANDLRGGHRPRTVVAEEELGVIDDGSSWMFQLRKETVPELLPKLGITLKRCCVGDTNGELDYRQGLLPRTHARQVTAPRFRGFVIINLSLNKFWNILIICIAVTKLNYEISSFTFNFPFFPYFHGKITCLCRQMTSKNLKKLDSRFQHPHICMREGLTRFHAIST